MNKEQFEYELKIAKNAYEAECNKRNAGTTLAIVLKSRLSILLDLYTKYYQ